jgi:hypothetical protein
MRLNPQYMELDPIFNWISAQLCSIDGTDKNRIAKTTTLSEVHNFFWHAVRGAELLYDIMEQDAY